MLQICSRCLQSSSRAIFTVGIARISRIHRSCFFSTHSSSQVTFPSEEEDGALINLCDFRGISAAEDAANEKPKHPETTLSLIHRYLTTNYRVSGEIMLFNVVRELEAGNQNLIQLLKRTPERWVPMLFAACGAPMSVIPIHTRSIIMQRLWTQLQNRDIPISLEAFNQRLKSKLQNEENFYPEDELKLLESELKLEPNEETFQYLLEKQATLKDMKRSKDLVYEMCNRGFTVNAKENAAIIFQHAAKGHFEHANSLVEKSKERYGEEAYAIAIGACVRGLAARGDLDHLRIMLRKSMNMQRKKFIFSHFDLFETIWHLARNGKASDIQTRELIEEMLKYANRKWGYFRCLVREAERHIAHGYYYTAVSILEDTLRIADCWTSQDRASFIVHVLNRMCRNLIREEAPMEMIKDIANRITTIFQKNPKKINIYHELLLASLTYKKLTTDQRIDYLIAFIDILDRNRKRPHIVLPLIAGVETPSDRLQVLYRCRNLGYTDLSQLDTHFMIKAIYQPLYDSVRMRPSEMKKRVSRLDRIEKTLVSYGADERAIWHSFFQWWEFLKSRGEKEGHNDEYFTQQERLQRWLKAKYVEFFIEDKKKSDANDKESTNFDYEKLKSLIEKEDSNKINSLLRHKGWPERTNFREVGVQLLNLYLKDQPWSNIHWLLSELSMRGNNSTLGLSNKDHPFSSPSSDSQSMSPSILSNCDLLRILWHCLSTNSSRTFTIREIIGLCYELSFMFPNATASYENFFNTLFEYNRLYKTFFDQQRYAEANLSAIDEGFELIRTLVKLNLIHIHPGETLSISFVNFVLEKLGWDHAVTTWMRFQSHLHLSNGLVALIRHCIITEHENPSHSQLNIQYVKHKAQNYISSSRVTTLHVITLLNCKRRNEAKSLFELERDNINPQDCVNAMRFMNLLSPRYVDEDSILAFSEMCLPILDTESGTSMIKDLLRYCEQKKLGVFAGQLASLYSQHGFELSDEDKRKLAQMLENALRFEREWIYEPLGLFHLPEYDEINTSDDTFRLKIKLLSELEMAKSRQGQASKQEALPIF